MRELIGTWRLVGTSSRDTDGAVLPQPYGPQAMGVLTLNANGRMMAVLCDGRSVLPENTRRDFVSYCGNYSVEGATLTTAVDASSAERIPVGGKQVRAWRFEGERLVLTPPAITLDGVMQRRELVWERLSHDTA